MLVLLFILVLLIAVLFSSWFIFKNTQISDEKKCELSGGKSMKIGFGARHYCNYKYEDAGKSCYSEKDCLGGCVVEEWDSLTKNGIITGGYRTDHNGNLVEGEFEIIDNSFMGVCIDDTYSKLSCWNKHRYITDERIIVSNIGTSTCD